MAGSENGIHKPVLKNEVLRILKPTSGNIYVDGTIGMGGHSLAILESSAPSGFVIGLDWDNESLQIASQRLSKFKDRIRIVQANYAEIPSVLKRLNIKKIDGILIDLGVSSLQLDKPERGFSFQSDGPLDMRMDKEKKVTAADLLKKLSKEELADIFFNYGEERQSRRIAEKLVEARNITSIITTRQLAEIVDSAVPKRFHPKRIHVATRVFQALRIAVNRELDNLVRLLDEAPTVLKKGAKICIITFHSIEDRIVKQAFNTKFYKNLTHKPLIPTDHEIKDNPRARSAKLRAATRV